MREDLRGEVTHTFIDMFGIEWPQYDNTKIYFITNVGNDRKIILSLLKDLNIEVLEEESIFRYIEIAIDNEEAAATLRKILKEDFDCGLQRDTG